MYYDNHSRVTWREALFSFLIIAILYGAGVWISNPLLTRAIQKADKIITATKVSDANNFDYIRRTNVGFFIAEGKLIANDTISLPDIPGIYSRIDKVKEEYRSHVETYTTTDSKGNTTTHTRIVWEWERVDSWDYITKTYTFLGKRFTGKEIGYSCSTTKDTTIYNRKLWGSDVRYIYYTTPFIVSGTMSGDAVNKSYTNLDFRRGRTIKETVEKAENSRHNAPRIFWVLWSLMIAAVVFLFVACENDWLEDKKNNVPM